MGFKSGVELLLFALRLAPSANCQTSMEPDKRPFNEDSIVFQGLRVRFHVNPTECRSSQEENPQM